MLLSEQNQSNLCPAVTRSYLAALFNNRIERLPPIFVRIVHHYVDEYRHQKFKDCRAVADLRAVDGAVPGGPAVDQLVTQNIKPVKNETQHAGRTCGLNGLRETAGGSVESLFPVVIAINPVMELPERVEHIPVLHEVADWTGKALPDGVVNLLVGIKRNQFGKEIIERGTFAGGYTLQCTLISVGGVECNPHEQESGVVIITGLLGAANPADRAVDPQAHGFREIRAKGALFFFQGGVGDGFGHGNSRGLNGERENHGKA